MTYIGAKDFDLEVARGNISGLTKFSKFGRGTNYDTADATALDVWSTKALYTGFPTGAAEAMEVVSSNGNDTSAGTGAQTVEISNLIDSTGAASANVTVTLNGTTPVTLGATTYTRASRIRVLTAGSTGGNEGIISLNHAITTANVFAAMPIGFNQTQLAAYTVPLGSTLYINRIDISMTRASGAAGSANVTVRSRPDGGAFNAIRNVEISDSHGYDFIDDGYLTFEAQTDIVVRVEDVSDNDTIVTAELDGYLCT